MLGAHGVHSRIFGVQLTLGSAAVLTGCSTVALSAFSFQVVCPPCVRWEHCIAAGDGAPQAPARAADAVCGGPRQRPCRRPNGRAGSAPWSDQGSADSRQGERWWARCKRRWQAHEAGVGASAKISARLCRITEAECTPWLRRQHGKSGLQKISPKRRDYAGRYVPFAVSIPAKQRPPGCRGTRRQEHGNKPLARARGQEEAGR